MAKDAEAAAEPTGDKKADSTEAAAAAEGKKAPSSSAPTTALPENQVAAAVAGAPGMVRPDKKSAIPEISYSSSDDDDFYDAEEQGRQRRDPSSRVVIPL